MYPIPLKQHPARPQGFAPGALVPVHTGPCATGLYFATIIVARLRAHSLPDAQTVSRHPPPRALASRERTAPTPDQSEPFRCGLGAVPLLSTREPRAWTPRRCGARLVGLDPSVVRAAALID